MTGPLGDFKDSRAWGWGMTEGFGAGQCRKKKKKKGLVAQSCLTLCSLPDSSVHGILQARILE